MIEYQDHVDDYRFLYAHTDSVRYKRLYLKHIACCVVRDDRMLDRNNGFDRIVAEMRREDRRN